MKVIDVLAAISPFALVMAGCAGSGSDENLAPSTPTVESSAGSSAVTEVTPTLPTEPMASDAPVAEPTVEFPPPGLPLRTGDEIVVGSPGLIRLIEGGHWLFAVEPPSTIVRIDPKSGDVARLDLELGESREGAVRHAFAGGNLWVIGGPFRDTLVEVDPVTLTETRRIQLDDDHAIRHGGPADTLWLSTLRGIRPVDLVTGEVGDVVPVEVDPLGIAVADDAVWVALPAAAQVARLDTTDGDITLFDTEPGPTGIAVADGIVWVTHPPTASISRIDARSGATLGVIDLDIGGDAGAVTDVPGLDIASGSVWVVVRLAGSAYEPIMIRLDPDTGQIRSARTIQIDGNTWAAANGQIWFHRADSGSIIPIDTDDFDDAPATATSDLPPASTARATSAPPSTTTPIPASDEQAVRDAFEQFIDPTLPSADLVPDALAPVRDALLDLLNAQVGGDARLADVAVDDHTGTARFDVVVEGDTVVLPDIEFVFERKPGTSTWTITESSLCTVADGVGIACP